MLTMNSDSSLPTIDNNKDHSVKVLHLMNQHRKENMKLCDVHLEVDNEIFPVHRSLLAACSPYFFAMFNGELKESKQKVIVLKDIKANFLHLIIDFVYTGNLDINIENVEGILELATRLQFCEVRQICCDFLEQQLDPVNCIGIRRFAHLHHCKSFIEVVDTFIKKQFVDVINSEEYTSLPYDLLLKIVSCNDLNIDCEERVYHAIIKWIKFDLTERTTHLYNLLSQIKLPLLSIRFIMNNIDKEPLVKNNLQCRDLLDDAKNYHLQPESHGILRSHRTIPRDSTVGLMFAIGGKEAGEMITDKCEHFSLYTNTWEPIAPLTGLRQQLGVCEFDGKIYAIAGYDGVNRLDTVEVYLQESNTWEHSTPLQTCRSGLGVGVLGEAIYALGGYDGRYCLDTVERFDPALSTWKFVASTNQTRSFPGVSELGGHLYAIGGNNGTTFLDSCECYYPMTSKWSSIASMNSPRAGVGSAVLDGVLYVAGGFDGSKRLDLVEMYDPRMNTWTPVAPMHKCRDGVSLIRYGSYLYAVGGIDGPSYLESVERYDPTADAWTEAVGMINSRAAAGVAILKNDVTFEL